jgi:hypothetical protein
MSVVQLNSVNHSVSKTVCMCIRPRVFKSNFVPKLELSESVLKCVSSREYFCAFITKDLKYDASIRSQCRGTYTRGNIIVRHFRTCNDDVKCQLFQSFCTSFYCTSL